MELASRLTELRPRRHRRHPVAYRDVIGGGPRGHVAIRALVRLRWIALAAQSATVLAVVVFWRARLPLAAIAGLLGGIAATNAVLPYVERRIPRVAAEKLVGVVVLLDVVFLTGLLALSGGAANPFSVLYLIHVMLAAIFTNRRWTWLVVAVSSAGYAALFFAGTALPAALGGPGVMHHGSFSTHLQGMWLAYTIAAATIATFVSGITQALREQRDKQERTARLLGLATLAAGAAHEIGNPLGTIRIAATELHNDLLAMGLSRQALQDLELIDQEVGRAHAVLDRLATSAGEITGESTQTTRLPELFARVRQRVERGEERIQIEADDSVPAVRWPVEAATQAFTQLLRNAVQASPPDVCVRCEIRAVDPGVAITIRDRGAGMAAGVLDRLGEPFFTTRPGSGMGLGVFIARSLIEHMGGQMRIESAPANGTAIEVWLPVGVFP